MRMSESELPYVHKKGKSMKFMFDCSIKMRFQMQ